MTILVNAPKQKGKTLKISCEACENQIKLYHRNFTYYYNNLTIFKHFCAVLILLISCKPPSNHLLISPAANLKPATDR